MKYLAKMSLVFVTCALGATAWMGCSDDETENPATPATPEAGGGGGGGGGGGDAAKPDTGTPTDGGGDAADASTVPSYAATLTGVEEAPTPVATTSIGKATFVLSADKTKLTYNVTHNVVGGTAAHIHLGEAGEAGGVVFPLEPFSAAMTGTITLTPADLANLDAGKLYVNIHSTANPNGELRGQIVPPGAQLFVARLTGAEENPPVVAASTGSAVILINPEKTKVRFHLLTTAVIIAAHIHRGIGTVNGPVAYPLAPTATTIDGELAITPNDITDFNDGRFYVNVHTAANESGELRGQLLKPSESLHLARMSGLNEVPPVVTLATGGGQFILSPDRKSLRYEVAVAGVTPTAAHIHTGAAGANGPVLYPLTLLAPGAKGTQAVTPANVVELDAAGLYLNVHSLANPDGVLRGQIATP